MQAALKSNEGKDEVVIDFLYPESYGTDPGVQSSVHIRGQYWDGDHTHSLGVSLEGLWLRTEDLQRLHDGLAGWLALPLAELEPAKLDGEVKLSRLPGQVLTLRFGHRQEIPSRLKPVVTITFVAGALAGEFHFITDQSCLSAFRADLSSQLETAQRRR